MTNNEKGKRTETNENHEKVKEEAASQIQGVLLININLYENATVNEQLKVGRNDEHLWRIVEEKINC